jgi:hypothetical protein
MDPHDCKQVTAAYQSNIRSFTPAHTGANKKASGIHQPASMDSMLDPDHCVHGQAHQLLTIQVRDQTMRFISRTAVHSRQLFSVVQWLELRHPLSPDPKLFPVGPFKQQEDKGV